MIEYKLIGTKIWLPLKKTVAIGRLTFSNYQIRIGGEIFHHNTAEFREAWKKEEFWKKLKQ